MTATIPAATRASLFNLVIYAKKDQREEYLQNLIKNTVRKYPCRIIFILEGSEGNFLNTTVSEIKPDGGRNPIFCDIINIEVSGTHLERIPFVILTHLLADRPVYLLWCDDPSKKNPVSLQLENCASRTVFDSESAEHMSDFAKTLLTLHDTAMCDIGDLNWARCAPWRALFAQTYNSPERLLSLQQTKHIEIIYNTTPSNQTIHTKIIATYFQAWLAIKLGWHYETVLGSKSDLSFRYQTEHGSVDVRLSPGRRENLPPGRIIQIELTSDHTEHMVFARSSAYPNKIAIQRTVSNFCEMPVYHMFDKEGIGRSMTVEIYSQGTSESFLKVLKLIAQYPYGVISSC